MVRLSDVGTGRLSGLEFMLVCYFELAMDMVRGGIREFVYDVDLAPHQTHQSPTVPSFLQLSPFIHQVLHPLLFGHLGVPNLQPP